MELVKLNIDKILNANKKPSKILESTALEWMFFAVNNLSKSAVDSSSIFNITYDFSHFNRKLAKYNLSEKESELIKKIVSLEDVGDTADMLTMWKNNGHKTYIPSKNLLNVLNEVELDLKSTHIPNNFNANFEFEGDIHMIHIEHQENMKYFTYKKLNNADFYSTFKMNINDLEKELLFDFVKDKLQGEGKWKKGTKQYERFKSLLLIINLVLFVSNSKDLANEYNKFTPSQKQHLINKGYTENPFVHLDLEEKTYEILRNRFAGEVMVNGHFKWQAYGPRWSKLRLIFIEPHIAKYKKLGEE
jgi:hypothetical protein